MQNCDAQVKQAVTIQGNYEQEKLEYKSYYDTFEFGATKSFSGG